jgi:hypothetical protein
MFDTLLADGIVSGASDRVAAFVVKCLAVAGGFLVGYFLGGVVAWALDRWVFAQKAPAPVKKAVAWVFAVALALLVALIVFGDGGNGLFGGGGASDGKGTPTQDDGKGKEPTNPPEQKKDEQPPKKDTIKPPTPKPTPGDMHIVILAGAEVKDGRFYLFEGDPIPKTFAEFKDIVNARRKVTDPPLKTVYYRFKNEELPPGQEGIRLPYLWLESLKIGFVPE